MEEIQDIFTESSEYGTEFFAFTEDGTYNLNGRPFAPDSTIGRISTLSELFTEWYLFDSTREKDINQFLIDENLTDIFTESEFMDLICGNAYLDSEMIYFIKMKLPFFVSLSKMESMNRQHVQDAYLIQHTQNIIDKNTEIFTQYNSERKEKTKQRKARYRATHREQIQQYDRMYRATHREKIQKREALYRATHREQIQQRDKKYYEKNKEKLRELSKKYYEETKEQYLARRKRYYETHREQCKQYCREYYQVNKERWKKYRESQSKENTRDTKHKHYEKNKEKYQRQHKENYEKNKEKYLAQQKKHREKLKQKAQEAQTMCAAYVFLTELRKTNRELYLTLYTAQSNPLISMLKTCVALQNMDINMCPLCNKNCGNDLQESCNQKLLSIPNSVSEIKMIAQKLKQR